MILRTKNKKTTQFSHLKVEVYSDFLIIKNWKPFIFGP